MSAPKFTPGQYRSLADEALAATPRYAPELAYVLLLPEVGAGVRQRVAAVVQKMVEAEVLRKQAEAVEADARVLALEVEAGVQADWSAEEIDTARAALAKARGEAQP